MEIVHGSLDSVKMIAVGTIDKENNAGWLEAWRNQKIG